MPEALAQAAPTDASTPRRAVSEPSYVRERSLMLNAIAVELIWRRLISIVEEAAAALVRTSFSSVVRESNDFACVITDRNGWSIAQPSNSIPSFIGTLPRTIRAFLEVFPLEVLEDGDILITNDIWLGTGHLLTSPLRSRFFIMERLSDSQDPSRMRPILVAAFVRPTRGRCTRKGCKFLSCGSSDAER